MTTKPQMLLPLPDPPERGQDDMTSVQHLSENGNLYHLIQYLGDPATTIVSGERYIVPTPGTPANQRISPDLLISFNANPALYRQDNSYVISRQGKPPDLVMEIASRRTGEIDTRDKPARYAALGISEYWRFDETGEFHGTRLAGDQLIDGRYEPIAVAEVEDQVLQGYSAALNLFIRWEHGELRWHDPETGQEIPTFEQEREARLAAEARVRELEAELAQRQEEGRPGGSDPQHPAPAGHLIIAYIPDNPFKQCLPRLALGAPQQRFSMDGKGR